LFFTVKNPSIRDYNAHAPNEYSTGRRETTKRIILYIIHEEDVVVAKPPAVVTVRNFFYFLIFFRIKAKLRPCVYIVQHVYCYGRWQTTVLNNILPAVLNFTVKVTVFISHKSNTQWIRMQNNKRLITIHEIHNYYYIFMSTILNMMWNLQWYVSQAYWYEYNINIILHR